MKRKLLFLTALVVSALGFNAKAQVTLDTDLTYLFPVDWQGWEGATGFVGWAAPQVTTKDGRTTAACERYNNDGDMGSVVTGTIFSRTLSGLANGTYRIELYGAAAYTFGRGINTKMTESDEGKMDVVYLYAKTDAGEVTEYIPIHWAENFNGSGISSAVLESVEITNGSVEVGMVSKEKYTNWHVIQIKGVTATVNAEELLNNTREEAKKLLEPSAGVKGSEKRHWRMLSLLSPQQKQKRRIRQ